MQKMDKEYSERGQRETGEVEVLQEAMDRSGKV